jgi:hypothetical protein
VSTKLGGESNYDAKRIDDIFYYTKMRQSEDQFLAQSGSNDVNVNLFEVLDDKTYTYIDRVVLLLILDTYRFGDWFRF